MKIHSNSFKSIPSWVLEQLLEEIKLLDFLPNARNVHAWLTTVGVVTSYDVAVKVLATIKPRWEATKKQQGNWEQEKYLRINQQTYESYQRWKKEKGFLNDAQAIEQLMREYFGIGEDISDEDRSETETNPNIPTPIHEGKFETTYSTQETFILLNQSELAKRLNVNQMLLSRNRNNRNFIGWSRLKDPSGTGWQWLPQNKKYQAIPKQKTPQD